MKDGGSAFPGQKKVYREGYVTAETEPDPGMSLRDYLASQAMAALIAKPGVEINKLTPEGILTIPAREGIPPLAYEYADAMLKAREAK